MEIVEVLRQPWPWYVAGPLIGLMVPLLRLLGNKKFGISSSLRHICAVLPNRNSYFAYDWRKEGGWNLLFVLGIVLGGFIAGTLLASPDPFRLAPATAADLQATGLTPDGEYVPLELFSLGSIFTLRGLLLMVAGGFFVGFGARYANGCTSGHAISGLANLQLPSLVAVVGFFLGGILSTYLLLPIILGL